ncbi:GumC family protein [Namhaeicola litoreus]|uniref:non-specific protein-tyrosine kinase n=1 Tax=Namhaeicola litoreus TaxID=1052145 RepID=A0ABW3Y6D9_9FLAO
MEFENSFYGMENKKNHREDNVREILEKFYYYRKWFIISVLFFLSASALYLYFTPKEYLATATIYINEEDSGMPSELIALKELEINGGVKTSIINETGILKSRKLIERVIVDLNLHISQFEKNFLVRNELYGVKSPFKISLFQNDSINSVIDTSFILVPKSNDSYLLMDDDKRSVREYKYDDIVKTSFGELKIGLNANKSNFDKEIFVEILPVSNLINYYLERLSIKLTETGANIISLSVYDRSLNKAKDLLNTLIKQYNYDAIEYKNLITQNTDKFVNDRISDITNDLYLVDKGVEEFKTNNNLTDIEFQSNLNLSDNSDLEKQIVDISSQIKLVDYFLNFINENGEDLLPTNIGLKDEASTANTSKYNALLMERNRILSSSSKINPAVVNLDNQLVTLKSNIIQSLSSFKSSLKFSLDDLRMEENSLRAKRNIAPKQEREFQDITRKQQIIESLYLYLLQKREENAMSMGVPVPNAKVIDNAYGKEKPIEPKPILVILSGLFLGGLLPFIAISLILVFNNKVETIEDIEKVLNLPVLGDIPNSLSQNKVIVNEFDASSITEAFRILRTNIDFMLKKNSEEGNCIYITSTVAQEGKSFIGLNLAATFASTGKKVLLIGADLRKPKIQEYLDLNEKIGLTNFLSNTDISIDEIILNQVLNNCDVILSGPIPPNPSNLLINERFEEVISFGKSNYDFVVVDTPPVSLVTDTMIISHLADLIIYVIRANFLDKRLLSTPSKLVDNKRLENVAILLNDTNTKKLGYGYSYGYS